MDLARESGIGFGGNLIFGDPAETAETFAESLSFWLTHCRDNFVFLGNLMPYPGSKVFDDYYKDMTFDQKKKYYENIDKEIPNMTTIPEPRFRELIQVTSFLERSWLFVKENPILSIVQEKVYDLYLRSAGGFYYTITARCPYCGEEIKYRERLLDRNQPFWLGTGCIKCNKKLKVAYQPK
jgi:hypothetical protein